jgi:signal transduction histidine kinase
MRRLNYLAGVCSGLRFQLMFLVVLLSAPFLLLILHTWSQERERAVASLNESAAKLADSLSAIERERVGQARQVLTAISETLIDHEQSFEPERSQALLRLFLAGAPGWSNLGIAAPNDRWLATARPVDGNVLQRIPVSPEAPTLETTVVTGFGEPPMRHPRDGLISAKLSSSRAGVDKETSIRATYRVPTEESGLKHRQFVFLAPHDERGRRNQICPSRESQSKLLRPAQSRTYLVDSFPFGGPDCLPLLDLAGKVVRSGDFTADEIFDSGSLQRIIRFGCPVLDRFGQVKAIVFATSDWFSSTRGEILARLPYGGSWTEYNSQGEALIHVDEVASGGREPSLESSRLKRLLHGETGIQEEKDSRGVSIIYGSALRSDSVGASPILGIIKVPSDIVFANADRLLSRSLIGLGIGMVLAIVLGWFATRRLILHPVQGMADCVARLSAGDFSTRSGTGHGRGELGRLTGALDRMAERLEQRELERRNVSHKLQTLSHKIVQIQESERRHIARELHDEIGQSLTIAEMNLQAAMQSVRQPSLTRRLQASVNAVGKVLEQVQDLSLNLRPSMLDDLGLEAALRWYIHRQSSMAGLEAELVVDPMENRLEPLIETECFRIAQEALTNIIRHANARSVGLELRLDDGQIHLRVYDDGTGFEVAPVRQAALRGASLGLLSMEERAALAGGGLEIDSIPGEGTRVHAWFPVKWRTNEPLA